MCPHLSCEHFKKKLKQSEQGGQSLDFYGTDPTRIPTCLSEKIKIYGINKLFIKKIFS